MDYQKLRTYFLIGLIAVVLSLWVKWQIIHAPAPIIATQTSNNGVPNLVNSSATTSAASTPSQVPVTQTGQVIDIDTPLVSMGIDTDGGNVVFAKLKQYPESLHSNQAITILNQQGDNQYIAESGLISQALPQKINFQASQTSYTASGTTPVNVVLTWSNNQGISISKTFTIYPDQYKILVNYTINNHSKNAISTQFYGQLLRTQPVQNHTMFTTVASQYTGAAISTDDNHYQKITFKDMDQSDVNVTTQGGWAAMLQHYFITVWAPNQPNQNTQLYSRVYNDVYGIGMANPAINIPVHSTVQTGATLYLGPAIAENLSAVAPYLDKTIDYGYLWFISQLLFSLMKSIYHFVGNWGWSIILVTVLIKIVFSPLSAKSYRSMANMRKLQPKIAALRERYKDDKQKLAKASMDLYKAEKVNPMGGCLPTLIQIPVFFALYWVIIESVELRQAPFILWIHDLSARDPYFILPVIMGLSMFIQQRLNPAPADPIQAKVMMFMPVIFTVMFLSFPSGLVLYWIVNSCIGILQQWWITRQVVKA